MFPVKTAVLRHHLRLHPDSEFHSQAVNPANQAAQGTAQLFYVYLPVSQTGAIRIPLSEPSVVQHHHFHAQFLCLSCDIQYLFSGKIKVGGFPVVDQHRPGNGLVLSPAKAAAHGLMDAARQCTQPMAAVPHDNLRPKENLPRFKLIGKHLILKPHRHPGLTVLVRLRLCLKGPAVHKGHAVTGAMVFGCLPSCQYQKWIILVAGSPSAASYDLGAVAQGGSLEIALHCVASVKLNQIVFPVKEVQTCTVYPFQGCRAIPFIFHTDCPGNNVISGEYAVEQRNRQSADLVCQVYLKALCVLQALPIHGRKAWKAVFPFAYFISSIAQIQPIGFVSLFHCKGRASEVP